jgi:O-antigen/teichoic acid export membrane protein
MHTYKRFAKGVGLIAISNALVSVSGIILLPVLTKNLSTGDYGAYVQVMTTVTLLAWPLTLGLPVALVRFVALSRTQADIREDFYSIFLAIGFVSLLASGILLLLSRSLAEYLFNGNLAVAEILPLITLFASLDLYLLDSFRAFQQLRRYAFFTLAQAYVGVVLISYFVFSGRELVGAVFGLLAAQVILFLVILSIIIARIRITIPHLKRLRTFMLFSVPLIPSNLSFWIVNSSDRYLIGIFLGASYVAYYSPSYTLGFVIAMLASPFNLMMASFLPKHYDDDDLAVVKTVCKYALKYFLAAAIPSVFIVSSLSKPLLLALSTPEIASNGYLVTPFIAFSALVWGTQSIFLQVIILEKKTRMMGVLWVVSGLMNFGLNIFLIPYLGIIGAAVTTLVSFSFIFISTSLYSRGFMKFDIDSHFIFKSIVASLAMIAVIIGLDFGGKFSILVAASAGVIVYLVLIVLMKGFDREEFAFFMRLFQNAPSK